jgi:Spy/CpxP family protein refolding chaperone
VVRKTILMAFASAFMLVAQPTVTPGRVGTAIFPPPPASFDELKANLGLSTAQVEQLVTIMQEKSEAHQAAYRQIAEKQTELNNLLNSGSRDVNRIGQLMLDIHTLSKQQPAPSNDQYRQRALAVLTAEQRVKLGPLDQAMKLNTPAWQAVTLNLVDPPAPGRPIIMGFGPTDGQQILPAPVPPQP